MKRINGDKQMTDVWTFPAISRWEKSCGKHPTQKPLTLLTRIILASTASGAWILDPFTGSSTTGIAASLSGRKFLGIDKEKSFLDLSIARRQELDDISLRQAYIKRITDFSFTNGLLESRVCDDDNIGYGLPF